MTRTLNVTIAENYRPHKKQLRVHTSGKRFISIAAGVRGGKTLSASVEMLRRIYLDLAGGKARKVTGHGRSRSPALRYWVVSPTVALTREPMRYLRDFVPDCLVERQYENQLWLKPDILIEAKSADNPLSLVAVGLDGILIDEAARVKPDAWRGQLRQRLSDRNGWAIFATTPLGKNWLYEDIVSKGLDPSFEDYESITWRTIDNPTIPESEVEAARRELPARYFTREYEADFSAFAGTVFPEWRDDLHVVSERELRLEYGWGARPLRQLFRSVQAGVDWGWNSPGCIGVIGDTGREYIMVDESYASHRIVYDPRLNDKTWVGEARRLKDLWSISQFHADPSEPGFIFDFSRAGIPIVRADNDITFGLRRMAEVIHPREGKPRFRVLDTCKNFIREVKSYVFDQYKAVTSGTGEDFKELPAQNQSDHSLDAGRYCLVAMAKWDTESEQQPSRTTPRGYSSPGTGVF